MYKNNWQQLERDFNSGLNEALLQQHHAAQFVAMVGRHLLPQKSDDSNTNMGYLPGSGLLAGNILPNGLWIALNLSQLRLFFLDKGSFFILDDPELSKENTKFRHNAEIVLNEIVATFDGGRPVKIWPHHFDTGAVFIILEDENGDTSQTIGIGFAIPDSIFDEPYYYLNFWSEKPVEGLNKLPSLDAGG